MIFILKLTGHKKELQVFLSLSSCNKVGMQFPRFKTHTHLPDLVLQKAHLNAMISFSNDNTWLKISRYTIFVNKKLLFHKHTALDSSTSVYILNVRLHLDSLFI